MRAKFIDDSRLHPRDNSGGPMGPKGGADWGSGGKSVGGEPVNPDPNGGDEMKGGRGRSRPSNSGGMY